VRIAVDTGGTFTDMVLDSPAHGVLLEKSPTVPSDPVQGVIDVLGKAATRLGVDLRELLGGTESLIYATTHAINAVVTNNTARTAFLVTQGHPDMLLFREGGRDEPFNHTRSFPDPYIPRSLTFEVRERIGPDGEVIESLDESNVRSTCCRLRDEQVEAVAVCLLWSVSNPQHELRLEEILKDELPDVPVTLSHRLNPALREFRRASSAALDASLKPDVARHLVDLEDRLRSEGLAGALSVATSSGALLPGSEVSAKPVLLLNSGPSMAPVAGRVYAGRDSGSDSAIVIDTGGTTFDISLVRRGAIPRTRETWIGPRFVGVMTGFPSVDVRSIGAGGGSIAAVDQHGLLHVGPASAGSLPGPVCYGRGGELPTVTDASLVLGHLDPDYFLGGAMTLDLAAAREAIQRCLAVPLGMTIEEAAMSVLDLATERMVNAIEEVTIHQGVDPRDAVVVAGGGAAGLNAALISRRLGCREVIFPDVAAALSAAGGLLSDMTYEAHAADWSSSDAFDFERANEIIRRLIAECTTARESFGDVVIDSSIQLWADVRYARQIWELEVPVTAWVLDTRADLDRIHEDFDRLHDEVFAIREPATPLEFVGWGARLVCRVTDGTIGRVASSSRARPATERRAIFLPAEGKVEADVWRVDDLNVDSIQDGPALVESTVTTIVISSNDSYVLNADGTLVVYTGGKSNAGE
jgi:N-methylhydantoinase A